MRITVHTSLGMAIVVLAASSLIADEKPIKGKQIKGKPEQSVVRIPKELVLDAQQKEAVAALNAEYLPKLEELKQRQGSVLTQEQKQALADAKRAAQQSGKDKAELGRLLRDAVKLTDEQTQQQAEIKQQFVALNAEIRERFMKLLTPEQRKLVAESKEAVKKTSGKTPGEKKPTDKKPLEKKPGAADPVKKPVKEKPASKKPDGKPTKEQSPPDKKPIDKKPTAEKQVEKQPGAADPTKKKPAIKKPADKTPTGKPTKEPAKEKKPAPATAAKKGDKSTKDPSAGKQPEKK